MPAFSAFVSGAPRAQHFDISSHCGDDSADCTFHEYVPVSALHADAHEVHSDYAADDGNGVSDDSAKVDATNLDACDEASVRSGSDHFYCDGVFVDSAETCSTPPPLRSVPVHLLPDDGDWSTTLLQRTISDDDVMSEGEDGAPLPEIPPFPVPAFPNLP